MPPRHAAKPRGPAHLPHRPGPSSPYAYLDASQVPQDVANETSAATEGYAHWAWSYPARRANVLHSCALARAALAYDLFLGTPEQAGEPAAYVTGNRSADTK